MACEKRTEAKPKFRPACRATRERTPAMTPARCQLRDHARRAPRPVDACRAQASRPQDAAVD
jgi:hypothetical protein